MSAAPIQEAYAQPGLYDLEHAAPERDVQFFIELAKSWQSKRILEIGCGNGRVTLPLARAARTWGGSLTGLEICHEMLHAAREKDQEDLVAWVEGNLVGWKSEEPFDLIISPCGSLGHLLKLAEQLECWRTVCGNLQPGGRFVVSEAMAQLPVLAESMQTPGRATVELDLDHHAHGERLLRYRTVRYEAHEQCVSIHYLYDRFEHSDAAKAVDGWIASAKSLKAELDNLKATAEAKARAVADRATHNLSVAAIWTFFGLLIGLLIAAMCGRCGAMCAVRNWDSKACPTGQAEASGRPRN